MRLLPCNATDGHGRASAHCEGKSWLPDGQPYYIGRAPLDIGSRPYRYRCSRCKRLNVIDVVTFNRLPDIPEPVLEPT